MFADMPLDNRTVDQFAALTAVWLFQVFLKPYCRQNDLIFRQGWSFCNIETKIRQYG